MISSRRCFIQKLLLSGAAFALSPVEVFAGLGRLSNSADGEDLPEYNSGLVVEEPKRYLEGILKLRSAHSGERREFHFRDAIGNYDDQTLHHLNWFLRCYNDHNYYQNIDIKVIEMLNYTSSWLGNPEILIHSGYRTPHYNSLLAKNNENVARNSLHLWGKAIDFSIPGIPIAQACSIAQGTRQVFGGKGGIGYYPRNGFVHIDSGERGATWVK